MKKKTTTQFFTFSQNNSGGSFVFKKEGITHYVVIEAVDANHAASRAEEIGLYFNGCDSGQDCECCGDRWYRPYRDDGDKKPMIYGKAASEYKDVNWMGENPEIVVHYLDGKIEWHDGKKKK